MNRNTGTRLLWYFSILVLTPFGLFLLVLALDDAVLKAILLIPFGWFYFLRRVIPIVVVDSGGVVTAIFCLAVFTAGLHRFFYWLHQNMHPPEPVAPELRLRWKDKSQASEWRFRWTATFVALVLLVFVAGISVVGVAHQTAWLATSPEPIIKVEPFKFPSTTPLPREEPKD